MNTASTLFNKDRVRSSRRYRYRRSLVAFAFITVLMVLFGGNAKAQPCTAATGPNIWCDIQFGEDVYDMPNPLRAALNIISNSNPVTMQRIARVWTSNGTLARPPVVVLNGGAGSTAAGNSGSPNVDFHVVWPQAIVVHTEATELVDHDGKWRTPPLGTHGPCWVPRFPHREVDSDHSDLDYIRRVLDEVDSLFPYHHDQVFVAGHSSGGFFTLSLMHFMPETFRAFAVNGCYADYERDGDDIAAIVAAGQKLPSRPILYMMGVNENVFAWLPAVATGDDKVYHTIRQLTARNGTEVPGQDDKAYLVNLTNNVQTAATAAPASAVASKTFGTVKPNSAEVVMTVYGGDHSWAPRDAVHPSLRAVEWVVDFFQQHIAVVPEEPNVLFDQGWTVPVLMAPVLF